MAGEIVIDSFLDDFDSFRLHCDGVNYQGETNPEDGVFYDGVSLEIPIDIKEEISRKLSEIHNREVSINSMFLRLSSDGMDAPHQSHTDAVMGSFSLMLYMNRINDCEGGTSLVVHKRTGLCSNPINKKQQAVWEQDHSNWDAWSIASICPMMPNRAFIFDSSLMHRAEPVGGFGNNSKDGRLVLTVFYD